MKHDSPVWQLHDKKLRRHLDLARPPSQDDIRSTRLLIRNEASLGSGIVVPRTDVETGAQAIQVSAGTCCDVLGNPLPVKRLRRPLEIWPPVVN